MPKDNGNLRRGKGLGPNGRHGLQEHGGYLAPPPQGGRPENFDKGRKARAELRERVGRDEDYAIIEVHKDLTSLAKVLLRKAERRSQVPARATMEVVKEYRQTQERINEMRRARGQIAEAEEFFTVLDQLFHGDADMESLEIEAHQLDADLEEIHKDLTSLTRKILRRAARDGEDPPRATMDVLREFRQTSEAVSDARRTGSAMAESIEFLATVEARAETVATRLAEGPVPVFEPSA